MDQQKKIKIAVIGSGLAGLSAAYLLTKGSDRFEVHLFEKNSSLGMDASSISIGPKKEHRIDVPMRSFMSGYYSHLFRLYQHLQIPAKKAKFSFGWYRIRQDTKQQYEPTDVASYTKNESYLIYSGARTVGSLDRVEFDTNSMIDTFQSFLTFLWTSCIVAFSYFQILFISLYMHHSGHLKNPDHFICQITLDEFFKRYRIHDYFAHQVFVPLFAAVCTNSYHSMLKYPASDVLEYMALGVFEESYVAGCGVQQVVKRLSAPLEHIHLKTQIVHIRPDTDHRYQIQDEQNKTYSIDHILFATQGNQAARILKKLAQSDPCPQSRRILQDQIDMLRHFQYDTALVINHTDTRLLPSNPSHWKALNLAMVDKTVDPGHSELIVSSPHDTTMTTHILNLTHHQIAKDCIYLQTTNPCLSVDPRKVLSIAWFERATVTVKSKRALQTHLFTVQDGEYQLGPCQGKNGIWFVGSYCWKGIPLLEGCVASAEYVVTKGIGPSEGVSVHVPW
jgi:predicted NAD/FAD-binding protein